MLGDRRSGWGTWIFSTIITFLGNLLKYVEFKGTDDYGDGMEWDEMGWDGRWFQHYALL